MDDMVVFRSIFDVVPGVVVVVLVISQFITDVVPVVLVSWLISGTVPGIEGFVATNGGLLISAIRINIQGWKMNYWKIENTPLGGTPGASLPACQFHFLAGENN